MKVDFLIIGAQKSGTSILDDYLRQHSQIEMANSDNYSRQHEQTEANRTTTKFFDIAREKEVHFFDREENFTKEASYEKYHSCFTTTSSQILRGESTPSYIYHQDVPERIWKYNPGMKLIAVLRNPIDRAFSHWNMERVRNEDPLSFSDAIRAEPGRLQTSFPHQNLRHSYIDRGFYSKQLQRLWAFFPRNQTLIIKQEELLFNVSRTLSTISTFLEIEPFEKIASGYSFSLPYTSRMPETDREYLRTIFYREIKELERLLNWNCEDWLK